MSIAVELPALGESVVEGTVARWLVREGDRVERDQPIVEVTTDKVDAEIPAPASGVLEEILVPEGETVPIGTRLASIDATGAGEAVEAPQPAAPAPVARPAGTTVSAPPAETAAVAAPPAKAQVVAPAGVAAGVTPVATPLAKRVAERAGIDVDDVPGSGARGRVTRADVEHHAAAVESVPATPGPVAGAPARQAPTGQPDYLSYTVQPGDEVTPMSPLRRLVAEHMVLSKRTSPHVGTVAEIDMGNVVAVRDAHKDAFRRAHGFGLSYLPFILQATVRALREHPALNASVLEDAIVVKRDIHVSVAVETDKGLVVPVVRHADRLSLTGLALAIEDLASRARSKRISPDELRGGTFTVSNPGRQGNLYGFAIINQPQVGILRVGEMVKRPVVRSLDGQDVIAVRPMMHLALSYDHRAVDGAPANGFLFHVRELLEVAEFDL